MADTTNTTTPLQPEEQPPFWLPAEFFTDDDFLLDKQNFIQNNSPPSHSASHSPYTTTKENVKNNIWLMSTSPKSTLTPSSPTTPFGAENDVVEELIQKAAGQVAMLKLSGGGGFGFGNGSGQNQSTYCFPQAQQPKNPSPAFSNSQMQRQMYQNRGKMGQAAWTIGQGPTQIRDGSGRRGVVLGKRECAGTGVFLPRARCETSTSNGSVYRRKQQTVGGSTTSITDRAVAHALDKSFDNTTCFGRLPSLSRMPLDARLIQNYDLLMARRHALLLRQQRNLLLAQRSSMISRDMYLPQEWTY